MKTIVILLSLFFVSTIGYCQEPLRANKYYKFESRQDSLDFANSLTGSYAEFLFEDTVMIYEVIESNVFDTTKYPVIRIFMNKCYNKRTKSYYGKCEYFIAKTKNGRFIRFISKTHSPVLASRYDLEKIKRDGGGILK